MSDPKEKVKEPRKGEDVLSLLLGLAVGAGGTTSIFMLFKFFVVGELE